MLCSKQTSLFCIQVLKLLNSNSENPYLIWNNGTRAELLEFLEIQQEGNIKRVGMTYKCFQTAFHDKWSKTGVNHATSLVSWQGENDKSFGAEFVFSDHSKELIVGEIFVRVYNEQPSFPLEVRRRKY